MWTYRQSDGEFKHDEEFVGTGYSGTGECRNTQEMESVPNVGPIPRGHYNIGDPYKHSRLGKLVMNLDPVGHEAFGRSAFRIHGDNTAHDASHGCIILGPLIRGLVGASDDNDLEV